MLNDDELRADEREHLRAWAEPDVPDDFADGVLSRWLEGDDEVDRATEVEARRLVEARRERARRNAGRLQTGFQTGFWIGMTAIAAAVVLALGLVRLQSQQEQALQQIAALGDDEVAALRDDAGTLLHQQCAPCHEHGGAGSDPAAAAVFSVDDPQWQQRLSDAQLTAAVTRMAEGTGGMQLAGFRTFVAWELTQRGAGLR
ncbi:MAG: hypothetical protein IPK74_08330 [Deltaproteobacteria bacterium]|nr:hypothetical protein [Deltaproteobacteria bacterium]